MRPDRYEEAKAAVLANQKASASLLQRHLKIGFNEACGYIERMEAEGLCSRGDEAGRRTLIAPAVDRYVAANLASVAAFEAEHGAQQGHAPAWCSHSDPWHPIGGCESLAEDVSLERADCEGCQWHDTVGGRVCAVCMAEAPAIAITPEPADDPKRGPFDARKAALEEAASLLMRKAKAGKGQWQAGMVDAAAAVRDLI